MQPDRTPREYVAAVHHDEHVGWFESFEDFVLRALADGVPAQDIEGWVQGVLERMSMSKHDAACILRREDNPYLCTCGLSDEEVAEAIKSGSLASDEEEQR